MKVHLADGGTLDTQAAHRRRWRASRSCAMAGIKTVNWEYGQSGIVCTVRARAPARWPRRGTFPAGRPVCDPAALRQPFLDRLDRADAGRGRLVAGDELVFEDELEQRFGLKLGEIKVEGEPRAWPLGLTLARDFVGTALRARRRRRTRHPSDFRPGPQSRLQGCGSAGRDHCRRRSSRPRYRLARRAGRYQSGGASTRSAWASPPMC